MKKTLLILIFAVLQFGCTENERAKNFGGVVTINVPPGKKIVTASFKGNDIWYLTRDRLEGEQPETLIMFEDSSYGLMAGKVVFVEQPK